MDSVDGRSSAGKLFQVSRPETAKNISTIRSVKSKSLSDYRNMHAG